MPGTESFSIDTLDSASGAIILKINGPLTLQTLFDFQEAVRQETEHALILDLSQVPYMDSGGLGSVINAFTTCQATNRGFAITGVSDRIRTLFDVTNVKGLLPCFDSLEAAEKSCTRSRK